MSVAPITSTGQLLRAWRPNADAPGFGQLFTDFYPLLYRSASALLRGERHVSLAAGDLVQEVFLRLVQAERVELCDRAHFMALASRIMRRLLIDHVRAKRADKRDHFRVTLTSSNMPDSRVDLHLLDHALARLGVLDPKLAEIVEMRYFGGMSVADVAEATETSEPTVRRRWTVARVWLAAALEAEFE